MSLSTLFNGSLSRKKYALFFLFGVVLTPVAFGLSILLALSLKEQGVREEIYVSTGLVGLFLIAGYFYIIKVKRLRKIGMDSTEIYQASTIPLSELLLQYYLFFKKNRIGHVRRRVMTDGTVGALSLKILLYIGFFFFNIGWIYFSLQLDGQIYTYTELIYKYPLDLLWQSHGNIVYTFLKIFLLVLLYLYAPYYAATTFWHLSRRWSS